MQMTVENWNKQCKIVQLKSLSMPWKYIGSRDIVSLICNIGTRWEIHHTYAGEGGHKMETSKMTVSHTAHHAQKLTTELY